MRSDSSAPVAGDPGFTPAALRRALRLSLADGVAWALMVGLAETYYIAIAVYLGATPLQLGLLAEELAEVA